MLCAEVFKVLSRSKIPLETIGNYLEQYTLPNRYGVTDRSWVSKKRLGKKKETLASFSSIMLSLVPILDAFLHDVIPEGHALYEHVLFFRKMRVIIDICSLGPEGAMPHVDRLRAEILEFGELFVKLYPRAPKPKFHHMYHIPDNMCFLKKLLSCFVTERKHRLTKRCALFVFRHIDNTTIKAILNRQCDAMRGDQSLFKRKCLLKPKSVDIFGVRLNFSTQALLPCGTVFDGDLVWFTEDMVGIVLGFCGWPGSDEVIVRIAKYARCVGDRRFHYDSSCKTVVAMDSELLCDTVTYTTCGGGVVRVLPPAAALVL